MRLQSAFDWVDESCSVRWRDVFGGQSSSFAEEELLHLLHQELLRLRGPRLQAVLVKQHLLPLDPLAPCRLGNVFEDLLTELRIEGRLVQTLHLALVSHAKNHMRHA